MNKKEIESVAKITAKTVHSFCIERSENEPMDGDQTESLAKAFLKELNKLNGNAN